MSNISSTIRRNSIAFISLFLAFSSLAYNTWRNEKTEANRNVRAAGIELLLKLGELDKVLFFIQYEPDQSRGSPREGWAYVLTIKDLGELTLAESERATKTLVAAWTANWEKLGPQENVEEEQRALVAAESISASIENTRKTILDTMANLD